MEPFFGYCTQGNVQKARVEASKCWEKRETVIPSFKVFDFSQDTHKVRCVTSAPSLSPLQSLWLITLTSRFCMPRRNKSVKGPQCSPKCHGRPSQWSLGEPALCKQEKQALESFLFRRISRQDKGSHYPCHDSGCCPGLWPRCHMLPPSLSLLSSFVCGDTELGLCSLL